MVATQVVLGLARNLENVASWAKSPVATAIIVLSIPAMCSGCFSCKDISMPLGNVLLCYLFLPTSFN